MTTFSSTADLSMPGLYRSQELWRFSAGIRLVSALLCAALLVTDEARREHPWALGVWLVYGCWAGWFFWLEATGRARHVSPWPFWIDVVWSCLAMTLLPGGPVLLAVLLVHPVVFVSIGHGVGQGLMLAAFATLGVWWQPVLGLSGWQDVDVVRGLPTGVVLALVPALAVLARPINTLGRRLALVGELGAQLDPRRGVVAISAELVDRIRQATQADVVALVLPSRLGGPAALASRADGSFHARIEVHMRLEALLAQVPGCPVSHFRRRPWDPRAATRLHAGGTGPEGALTEGPGGLGEGLGELCELLDVASLQVVPLTRYAQRHGYFVVGRLGGKRLVCQIEALASVVPEMLRILEQAALVDQLQEESAAHERARIGRDLHDSAIQPYLGLKYAVESVALRIAADNPARAEVDSLARLVNQEVATLRELISGMRSGLGVGDNALIPAVRRQVRRFALLFGVDVQVDCPDAVATSRTLASAIFHMVNESLSNVRKHSGAQRVWLSLSVDAGMLRLAVRDDGGTVRGHRAADFRPGSLSDRVQELGGSLQVTYPDRLNTELVIQIPV